MKKPRKQPEVTEKELDTLINYLQDAIIEHNYGNEITINLRGDSNGNVTDRNKTAQTP
jgi:hypothetical protein